VLASQMTFVFPAIKKISNELGGQCTQIPTAGVNQMIPPDEKRGTKAPEHKVRDNFYPPAPAAAL